MFCVPCFDVLGFSFGSTNQENGWKEHRENNLFVSRGASCMLDHQVEGYGSSMCKIWLESTQQF